MKINFDASWRKWSTGQGHETFNFGVEKVRGDGQTMSKALDSLTPPYLADDSSLLATSVAVASARLTHLRCALHAHSHASVTGRTGRLLLPVINCGRSSISAPSDGR